MLADNADTSTPTTEKLRLVVAIICLNQMPRWLRRVMMNIVMWMIPDERFTQRSNQSGGLMRITVLCFLLAFIACSCSRSGQDIFLARRVNKTYANVDYLVGSWVKSGVKPNKLCGWIVIDPDHSFIMDNERTGRVEIINYAMELQFSDNIYMRFNYWLGGDTLYFYNKYYQEHFNRKVAEKTDGM